MHTTHSILNHNFCKFIMQHFFAIYLAKRKEHFTLKEMEYSVTSHFLHDCATLMTA